MQAKDVIAAIIGALILVAFGVFIVYLLRNLRLEEIQWARAFLLFGGVEAIAFAAAGYFFGTQVQRGKVEEAKAEAEAATQVAAAADESAKSERRASSVIATGIVRLGEQQGGLLGDENTEFGILVDQARALLEPR
jgi:hypothetical protein